MLIKIASICILMVRPVCLHHVAMIDIRRTQNQYESSLKSTFFSHSNPFSIILIGKGFLSRRSVTGLQLSASSKLECNLNVLPDSNFKIERFFILQPGNRTPYRQLQTIYWLERVNRPLLSCFDKREIHEYRSLRKKHSLHTLSQLV